MTIIKVSEAHTVLRQAPESIRGLVKHAQSLEAENADLRKEVAEHKLEKRASKIAKAMEEKGLIGEEEVADKTAALLKEPEKLAMREEAVEMAAKQDFGLSLSDEKPGGGKSDLEAFILGED